MHPGLDETKQATDREADGKCGSVFDY